MAAPVIFLASGYPNCTYYMMAMLTPGTYNELTKSTQAAPRCPYAKSIIEIHLVYLYNFHTDLWALNQ